MPTEAAGDAAPAAVTWAAGLVPHGAAGDGAAHREKQLAVEGGMRRGLGLPSGFHEARGVEVAQRQLRVLQAGVPPAAWGWVEEAGVRAEEGRSMMEEAASETRDCGEADWEVASARRVRWEEVKSAGADWVNAGWEAAAAAAEGELELDWERAMSRASCRGWEVVAWDWRAEEVTEWQ